MLRLAFAFALLTTPAFAFCTTHGGVVDECAALARRFPPGHVVPGQDYVSGGTFILRNAGCISPDARFGFHSAHRFGVYEPHNPDVRRANETQRRVLSQHPHLVHYLDSVGAFRSVGVTMLTAEQVSALTHVPLCQL